MIFLYTAVEYLFIFLLVDKLSEQLLNSAYLLFFFFFLKKTLALLNLPIKMKPGLTVKVIWDQF